jgi:hypothetical protein
MEMGMKSIVCASACASIVLLGGCVSYQPTTEQDFRGLALNGCKGDQELMVRGQVSSATENTVVLSDPSNSQSTMSVKLPGRGTVARLQGMVGTSKYEESRAELNRLGTSGTPVTVTMQCQGHNAPLARNITYDNADGSRSSITF